MGRFGTMSLERLDSVEPALKSLFDEVVMHFDCAVITGHRGEADQNEAFDDGKSHLRWPNGKHNKSPSRAVDVAPYPINWNDTARFYYFGGYVLGVAQGLGIRIRWGGDWDSDREVKDQTFNDLVHFELK